MQKVKAPQNFDGEKVVLTSNDPAKIIPTDTHFKIDELTSPNSQQNNSKRDSPAPVPPQELKKVSFAKLLSLATRQDQVMMAIGLIAAAANGTALPLFALIFGQMTSSFSPTASGSAVVDMVATNSKWFAIVGAGSFACSWIMFVTWMVSGERQAIEFRRRYFQAILKQEIGWFDSINPNELATQVAQQCFAIQGAIGEKVPTFVMTLFMTIGGFIVGYVTGWEMSLVCTAALPAMSIGMFMFLIVMQSKTSATTAIYDKAGGIAEEALTAMKTVKSLHGEDYELKRYNSGISEAMVLSIRYTLMIGFSMGFVFWAIFSDYALSFWYGSECIQKQYQNRIAGRPYNVGDVMVIFFAIQIGGFSLGQAAPCMEKFAQGCAAGYQVFQILERKPLIRNDAEGKTLKEIKGNFCFNNVFFCYPAKPDVPVLRGLTFEIEAGKKTALVGESGSGKSTCMQLIERFYDVEQVPGKEPAAVTLDGVDVKQLDLYWLRENIGYVGQEPVLFATTIRENLRYGKKTATEEEMWAALEKANAKNFVNTLQDKLDTFVGSAGSQFSGGQKQRLCIARAILKNPPILLFDEATSALDRANEMSIQKTLDDVSRGRTTIVIAHRFTTVQNSDKIIVLDQGKVAEEGCHQDLIVRGGRYEALAKNQVQGEIAEASQVIENYAFQKSIANTTKNSDVQEITLTKLSDAFEVLLSNSAQQKISSAETLFRKNISQFRADTTVTTLKQIFRTLAEQQQQQAGALTFDDIAKQVVAEQERRLAQVVEGDLDQEIVAKISDQVQTNKISSISQKPSLIGSGVPDTEKGKAIAIQVNGDAVSDVIPPEEKDRLEQEQKKLSEEEEEKRKSDIMKRLFTYNQPEKGYFYFGLFCCLANGGAFPISAYIMANMIWLLSDYYNADTSQSKFRNDCNRYALYFFLIGIVSLFSQMGMFSCMARVGEGLTYRLRYDVFSKILRMPASWFDDPQHNPGTLAVRLASEATIVNALTSNIIGLQVTNLASFTTGMIIAFYFSWQLTLVNLALSPFLVIAAQLQAHFVQGFSSATDEAYKDSGNLVQEAVTNIRTVASFGNEQILIGFLNERLKKPQSIIVKKSNIAGLSLGYSQLMMFAIYAIIFYVGALFHRDQDLPIKNMFTAIFAIMFASLGAGNNNQFMVDVGQAHNAAKNIFAILDAIDEVQEHESKVPKSQQITTAKISGEIEFRDVVFRYPSRERTVLNKISFKISPGQKAAFVGPSGCGKSTIMQLLLRFYEPQEGQIFLDGADITRYDLATLRSYFGVVSQEPVLFNATIRENIRYNAEGMDLEQIRKFAAQANALEFIERNNFEVVSAGKVQIDQNSPLQQQQQQPTFGSGFDKSVGAKGTQISGGQKQRIAIARAIAKNPQILLLDEATSALDSENEKIVQESLDKIMQGKTSLAIAHRISTIKDSAQIFVMEDGCIMERGNYEELLKQKGFFYRLEKGEIK